MKNRFHLIVFLVILSSTLIHFKWKNADDDFVFYTVNLKQQELVFYLKNNEGVNFGSIKNLKTWLNQNDKELIFAMNGGMYKKDKSPQGLYIENKITITEIDTNNGNGNFYLKPNGIFYIKTSNEAEICRTEDFKKNKNIKFATQSGPMLVIEGEIHKAFNKSSFNINIRNGVGILPNNKILFTMSKKEINFYEFAEFFKNKGCVNALYLDGFVSRTYCPSKNWFQTDGDFGVIIGVVTKK